MNILYLGSYRDNSADGDLTRNYIDDLSKNHALHIKPYRRSNHLISIDNKYSYLENTSLGFYDACIQHLPIGLLSWSGLYKKNIAIPVFDNKTKITNPNIIQNLNRFDQIIVNNERDLHTLLRSGVNTKISQVNCHIKIDKDALSNKRFNFGAHNNNHKFYGFFDYEKDANIIHNILTAFFIAFRCREGQSLILSILADQVEQQELLSFIKQTKTKLNILDNDKSLTEIFLFYPMNLEDKIVLHNTCETLLNFSNDNSIIHKNIAIDLQNNIIDQDNTECVEIPCDYLTDGIFFTDEYQTLFNVDSLVHNMREFVTKKPETQKQSTYSTIDKVLI